MNNYLPVLVYQNNILCSTTCLVKIVINIKNVIYHYLSIQFAEIRIILIFKIFIFDYLFFVLAVFDTYKKEEA
jgi:hypothetical protein